MSATNGAALSRRGFLAGTGGLFAAITLAACAPGGGAGSSATTLSLLLPGVAPTGWDGVRDAVNKKLKADLGFEFKPQFINWSEYPTQSLLKFTAQEKFETALSARWLNMAQLVESGAIIGLNDDLTSGKYENLTKTIDTTVFDANRWDGELYGIPAVNSAARLHHYVVRGDLVEKYAGGELTDFDSLEKFWYDVKQKENILGFVDNLKAYSVIAQPTGTYNAESWASPNKIPVAFAQSSLQFYPAQDAAATGSSKLSPFWEDKASLDALKRVRQYYNDGIINADILNIDTATVNATFDQGGAASTWAITDGLDTSAHLGLLQKAVPGSSVMTVLPFSDGIAAKPNQTFQADNLVVVNAAGRDNTRAMQLLDWLSIKENHDLLQYGVEGKDWTAEGDDKYTPTSEYNNFPGYALSWRVPLERKSSQMSESEDTWFEWSKNYDNFTLDPFATFIPDLGPVEAENSQITAAIAEFGNPLFAGAVDVDSGLDALKKAVDGAGLSKLQAELEKQADAYLAAQ